MGISPLLFTISVSSALFLSVTLVSVIYQQAISVVNSSLHTRNNYAFGRSSATSHKYYFAQKIEQAIFKGCGYGLTDSFGGKDKEGSKNF